MRTERKTSRADNAACDRGLFPSGIHLYPAAQDCPAQGACAGQPRDAGYADKLQSCSGISFKSQVLYLLVYVTRYLGMAPLLIHLVGGRS